MISHICDAFKCTPADALRQDPQLVRAVLDYRRLVAFEANKSGDTIDYDELTFVDEVKALAFEKR